MKQRSKYFIKRFNREKCKPVTVITLAAMWNASMEFDPGIPHNDRKAMIMYFWVRAMSANLHHWVGWWHVHFYAQGLIRLRTTKEEYLKGSDCKHYPNQNPEDLDFAYQAYLSWGEICKRDWETEKTQRAKFVKALTLLSVGGAWKTYADVSVPAFDRWMKSNVDVIEIKH